MAHVSGPTSTMPGFVRKLEVKFPCDGHNCSCTNTAEFRIQMETDSFGAEYADYCSSCYELYKKDIEEYRKQRANTEGWCEFGKHMAKGITQMRDFEEGSSGRLYDVCPECRRKYNEAMREELDYD